MTGRVRKSPGRVPRADSDASVTRLFRLANRLWCSGNLDSLAVAAVGSVDRDFLSLVDEERNHDLRTGLEGHFLQRTGRSGVALDCRLRISHLEGDIGRKLAGKALLLRLDDEHHLDMLALFHKVGILDYVVRKMDLLICLFVHEVESVLV